MASDLEQWRLGVIRTVVLSVSAQESIDREIASNPRMEEMYLGLEFRLARAPQTGTVVPDSPIRAYVMHLRQWLDCPELVALYTFDADRVDVLQLRTIEPDVEVSIPDDKKGAA